MPSFHRVLVLLLPFLPACAVSMGTGREAPPTKSTETPPLVAFAIIRKPGTRIPLNPQTVQSVPVVTVPIAPETSPTTTPKQPPQLLSATVVPAAAEAPIVAILRSYVEGRPEEAMPWIQMLEKPNRELVLQLVPALVKASKLNPAQADPKELAVVAEQFLAVANLLNKRAPLAIEKAIFCRSVSDFGHYDPLPDNAVHKPGTMVTIYFQLGNVNSEPTIQSGVEGYLTKHICSCQIRDANGRVLDIESKDKVSRSELIETKAEFSQSLPRDHFLRLWFTAPNQPGKYTVHFKVKDATTLREVVQVMSFRVN